MINVVIGKSATDDKGKSVATLVGQYFYLALLELFYFVFSLYRFGGYIYHRLMIRWLTITYHQNRTPELIQRDVANFTKIPRGIGAVLTLHDSGDEGGGVDGLLEQASDLAAWCIGTSIEFLVLYERTGVLKALPEPDVRRRISRKLEQYYGADNVPTFKISFPYTAASYSDNSTLVHDDASGPSVSSTEPSVNLTIRILSVEDGRQSIVDLTRSLATLAKEKKISARDINVKTIDHEIKTLVSDEPDLVYVFGPVLDLDGFPPWQIRLSEIFYMRDNDEVSYAVFLKGLEKYSGVKINVGR
ncbi:uncharacterized protein SAPINGB_P001667 [Magnusiomyces paraingens]|uniref:ditrans,polycis-polyprenyl diphosphate synthase [(2E,6E)-farnesyldiphosphate specific] n=1 Tax=Magnusiomyces paraingens TaxID=2606893 RepID=A0A5E8B6V6_9ASCO|nr:uncharacterized protein SAPINGB_P001667 [Saprochaete ingens]VVT47349.1 unnamed protein product [Saprochaete ingens]